MYLSGRFNLLRKEGEGERISWAKERGRKSEEIRSYAVDSAQTNWILPNSTLIIECYPFLTLYVVSFNQVPALPIDSNCYSVHKYRGGTWLISTVARDIDSHLYLTTACINCQSSNSIVLNHFQTFEHHSKPNSYTKCVDCYVCVFVRIDCIVWSLFQSVLVVVI